MELKTQFLNASKQYSSLIKDLEALLPAVQAENKTAQKIFLSALNTLKSAIAATEVYNQQYPIIEDYIYATENYIANSVSFGSVTDIGKIDANDEDNENDGLNYTPQCDFYNGGVSQIDDFKNIKKHYEITKNIQNKNLLNAFAIEATVQFYFEHLFKYYTEFAQTVFEHLRPKLTGDNTAQDFELKRSFLDKTIHVNNIDLSNPRDFIAQLKTPATREQRIEDYDNSSLKWEIGNKIFMQPYVDKDGLQVNAYINSFLISVVNLLQDTAQNIGNTSLAQYIIKLSHSIDAINFGLNTPQDFISEYVSQYDTAISHQNMHLMRWDYNAPEIYKPDHKQLKFFQKILKNSGDSDLDLSINPVQSL